MRNTLSLRSTIRAKLGWESAPRCKPPGTSSVSLQPRVVYCMFLYLVGLLGLGVSMPRMYDIAEANHHDPLFLNITNYRAYSQ